jgi:glycosyltransferase involved in cell wall biosynthesis
MKILIDLTSLADNFSGIERFALCITKEMIANDKAGNNSYILVFKNEIHPDFVSVPECVKSIVVRGRNKLIFNQLILPVEIGKIKADIYFFPAFPAPFFFFSRNAVTTIHDIGCWDCPSKNKQYMTWYFKIMYWKAAFGKKRVVTVSEFSKQRIAKILKKDESQIKVVYDGLSDCFERFEYSEEMEKKAIEEYSLPMEYLLCLSTLEPRKNIRLLIEAYDELLSEKKLDIDLVLAGRKGWLVDDLLVGLSDMTVNRIHFTGFVDENLLPYVYRRAKAFVFPSIYEGFGVPPIEAMSMGIPVISSDAASLPEVLGDAAFLFKNKDKQSLKDTIIKVLSLSDGEIEQVQKKGIEQAHMYNWSREAKKLFNELHCALDGGQSTN